ncbi:unnamed protein product [Ectocarpus sp. 12 AP-2014]
MGGTRGGENIRTPLPSSIITTKPTGQVVNTMRVTPLLGEVSRGRSWSLTNTYSSTPAIILLVRGQGADTLCVSFWLASVLQLFHRTRPRKPCSKRNDLLTRARRVRHHVGRGAEVLQQRQTTTTDAAAIRRWSLPSWNQSCRPRRHPRWRVRNR